MRSYKAVPFQMDLLSLKIAALKPLDETRVSCLGWRQQAEGWVMLIRTLFTSGLGCENANE